MKKSVLSALLILVIVFVATPPAMAQWNKSFAAAEAKWGVINNNSIGVAFFYNLKRSERAATLLGLSFDALTRKKVTLLAYEINFQRFIPVKSAASRKPFGHLLLGSSAGFADIPFDLYTSGGGARRAFLFSRAETRPSIAGMIGFVRQLPGGRYFIGTTFTIRYVNLNGIEIRDAANMPSNLSGLFSIVFGCI